MVWKTEEQIQAKLVSMTGTVSDSLGGFVPAAEELPDLR